MESRLGTVDFLTEQFARMLAPFRTALGGQVQLQSFLSELGWETPESIISIGIDSKLIVDLQVALESVMAFESENQGNAATAERYTELFTAVSAFIKSIDDIDSTIGESLDANFLATSDFSTQFRKRFFDFLFIDYIFEVYEPVFDTLIILGIFERKEIAQNDATFTSEHTRNIIHFDRLKYLLSDPVQLFRITYAWGAPQTDLGLLINRLFYLFTLLDIPVELEFPVFEKQVNLSSPVLIPEDGETEHPELRLPIFRTEDSNAESELGFTIFPIPALAENSGSGLAISPYASGDIATSKSLDDDGKWFFEIAGNLDFTYDIGIIVRPTQDINVIANILEQGLETTGSAIVELRRQAEPDETNDILSISGGSRLCVQTLSLKFGLNMDTPKNTALFVELGLENCKLVISAENSDGFLQKILPQDPAEIGFDIILGISSVKGFYIKGGVGFTYSFIVNKSIGPIYIYSIDLKLATNEESLTLISAISVSAKIGPVTADVQEMGLLTMLEFDKPGLLGNADLDIGFKSPTSIGLSINAEGITGGGFLKVDPPNYAGVMRLSFKNEIELTAFGLITTQLPDGKDGFSLVIQIMAEFQPIQLGLGFALSGVGGLIGINRQINEEALTEAFKNHSLDTFLFPENPIKDAVKIIDSIQTIMPPREGYHVIGPMVQMFWGGSVRLVEFEVGIFIQTGGPLKVVLIGQARTQLPEGKSPRLVINMDVLGIIDYGEERIAIDAVLFNSRILNYALDGKMALRSDWSTGEESFALSVGGFHPEFRNIPVGFPQLTRLMVTIGSGNPRLTLQMYLAITPNTLQIGARLELWAKKSGFTITGGTSFDVLFTFSPFSFLAIINIWANIKRGRIDLGVDLELELSGPNPMIAIGYAKFKIGWFSKKVRFRKQFGNQTPDPLPVVSPLAALLTALEHKRSIRFELPVWASASLVFAQTAELKIDPVADIIISQSTVPLNFNMQRFGGGNPPLSEQRLSLTAGFEEDKEKITKTLFAPEQFKNWSTEERLSAKAFENYDAGIRFSGDYIIPEEAIEKRDIGFETVLRDSRSYRSKLTKNDVRREKFRTTCVKPVSVAEVQYFVNWTLFGSNNYFKPLRKVRDKNHVYSIKVLEPGYVLTDTYQQEGSAPAPVIENQKQHAMSYAEALDAFKDDGNPQSVIRSATEAFAQ